MRTLVYSLMTLSVVTIVGVLMLVILGYSFNRQDGKLEQGGLLQFASVPSGAIITLDGIQTGSRTPSKASVEASDHHVKMDLKGFRSWQKSITVEAGGIGWLSYARFVPTDVKTEHVRVFPRLSASLATPDRKWIIAQEDSAANSFHLINIESDQPKLSHFAIPEDLLTVAATATPQNFQVTAWSRNDDKILIKRTYDTDKTEWLVVDRQDVTKTVNLTTAFAVQAVNVQFGERDGKDVYVLTSDGIVRRIDVGAGTLSGPLAEHVAEYSIYDGETVLYVTHPDDKMPNQRHIGYRANNMDKAQTIFSYPAGTENIHVAFGDYYGQQYVAVTQGTQLSVYTGELPSASTKGSLERLSQVTLSQAPQRVTIGENGRFAVAEMADSYTTYDIELHKSDTTTFSKPSTVARQLQWLDAYLIADDRGGTMRLYEFDGANQQDIMPVIEGQAMSLTGNEKFLYGFSSVDNGVALTRARMTVNN